MRYKPPFTITNTVLSLIAEVSEMVGRQFSPLEEEMDLKLRRVNQIKTICGSLAIEGNTLSEEQIPAMLNGKPVLAPAREVQEAKNALAVYERLSQFNPRSEDDLLKLMEY